jgi:hypothetical protein
LKESRKKNATGRRATIAALLCLGLVIGLAFIGAGAAAAPTPYTWTKVSPAAGFSGNPDEVESSRVFNNKLYVGTAALAQVWAWDGSSWAQANTTGFDDPATAVGVPCLAIWNNHLVAGTSNPSGGEVYEYSGTGTAWTEIGDAGLTDPTNDNIRSLAVLNGVLYACGDSATGAKVWAYSGSGTAWSQVNTNGFGNGNNDTALKLAVLDNSLYAATHNAVNGTQVYVWTGSGTTWNQVNTNGFNGAVANDATRDLLAWQGKLYAGTENAAGCQVWSYPGTGTTWTQLVGQGASGATAPGFGDTNNTIAYAIQTFAGKLEVGTRNTATGGQTWEFDGASWGKVNTNGFNGTAADDTVETLSGFQNRLYAGTRNLTSSAGAEVWRTQFAKQLGSTGWFMPEGSTAAGFDTWILIQNPSATDANCQVQYLAETGPKQPFTVKLVPQSRMTLHVSDKVPNDFQVSTAVTSDVPVVCERSMYWNKDLVGETNVPGSPQPYQMRSGHADLGVPAETLDAQQGTNTYFAEGATAGGFNTWIDLANVEQTLQATAHLTFMTENGVAATRDVTVAPMTRSTVHVNAIVPNSFNVGCQVTSNMRVVAERSMYWDQAGAAVPAFDAEGGISTLGASQGASQDWFLAEGSTGMGFANFIQLLNPQAVTANVTCTFMNENGIAGTAKVALKPRSRGTINVEDFVPNTWRVATKVTADQAIVAERTMFWNKQLTSVPWAMRDGHSTTGVVSQGPTWLVPEGSTGGGFDSWVLVTNPNDTQKTCNVTFMTESGPKAPVKVTLPANSRVNVRVSDFVPNDFSVSTTVQTADGSDVVVERAMYWDKNESANIQPWQMMGGHAASSLDP